MQKFLKASLVLLIVFSTMTGCAKKKGEEPVEEEEITENEIEETPEPDGSVDVMTFEFSNYLNSRNISFKLFGKYKSPINLREFITNLTLPTAYGKTFGDNVSDAAILTDENSNIDFIKGFLDEKSIEIKPNRSSSGIKLTCQDILDGQISTFKKDTSKENIYDIAELLGFSLDSNEKYIQDGELFQKCLETFGKPDFVIVGNEEMYYVIADDYYNSLNFSLVWELEEGSAVLLECTQRLSNVNKRNWDEVQLTEEHITSENRKLMIQSGRFYQKTAWEMMKGYYAGNTYNYSGADLVFVDNADNIISYDKFIEKLNSGMAYYKLMSYD